ncbi:MAG: iron chelate uptake ABC transporter family permease subunit [Actinomycetota bacterium]|nr:iron chelate uptake ABC transporter family permease subunit [Actinomycetota bacterium]
MITIALIFSAITIAPILAGLLSNRRDKETGPFITNHILGLTVSLILVIVIVLISLRFGSLEITWRTAWNAIFNYDTTNQGQIVVRELRLPRTILGLAAGSCLAVAGALTQGITRNPLGAPGILGVNAGAAFAIVTAIYAADIVSPEGYVWFAFFGAAGASILVYFIAQFGGGGATPVKLALAGVVITALLGGWTTSLLILDLETLDEARFWLAGSIASRGTDEIAVLFPVIVIALFLGISLGKQINILSLGEDIAISLGQRITTIRTAAGIVIILLCGSAVAIAGPIAFVGLAIPHMVRSLVGPDYRWILLYSLFLGPCLLLGADVIGRLVVRPTELQVGIVTAAAGAPFLIYLVRFTKLSDV